MLWDESVYTGTEAPSFWRYCHILGIFLEQKQSNPCIPKIPHGSRRSGQSQGCLPPAAQVVAPVLTPSCTRTSASPGCYILLLPTATQLYPSPFSSASSPGLATVQEQGLCPTSAAGCWPHPTLCLFLVCRKAELVSVRQGRSLGALFGPWENKTVVSSLVFPLLLILFILRG